MEGDPNMYDSAQQHNSYEETARQLAEALGLTTTPIALAFVDNPPPDVPTFSGTVPSACAFWPEAEQGSFYASAAQHANCPLGAHVMGFPADESQQGDLQSVVEKMCGCEYIAEDEPANIPTVKGHATGIVYGPLDRFPLTADLVLLWLQPSQAMLLQETAGRTRWGNSPPSALLGRPGCAALPIALETSEPTLSAGCIGMRTFTGVSENLLLAVLPAPRLESFLEAAESTRSANRVMREYYETRQQLLRSERA